MPGTGPIGPLGDSARGAGALVTSGANGVAAAIQKDGGFTPTPVVSHAILAANRADLDDARTHLEQIARANREFYELFEMSRALVSLSVTDGVASHGPSERCWNR